MANKIKTIPCLEKILKNRYHKIGKDKIEIGNYWSILQIYLCMRQLDISILTLCGIASQIEGRIDAKGKPTTKDINTATFRKYLKLESVPSHLSHTVITKKVSSGVGSQLPSRLRQLLEDNNSYGPKLHEDILSLIKKQRNELISKNHSVMGMSDYACVLKLSLTLRNMCYNGFIGSMSEEDNSEHIKIIINKIMEYQVAEDKDDSDNGWTLQFMPSKSKV